MRSAADGEEVPYESPNGDGWTLSWHSPLDVPGGTPHGANAFCIAADNDVVLISADNVRFGWPGGRPEGDETWEQTLRREMLEEACAEVTEAKLLGFIRSTCLSGSQQGLVLVRSVWRAEVVALPWAPEFEIPHRKLVPIDDLLNQLYMEPGLEPLYHRVLHEAGLL